MNRTDYDYMSGEDQHWNEPSWFETMFGMAWYEYALLVSIALMAWTGAATFVRWC